MELLDKIQSKLDCEQSLLTFVQQSWSLHEPAKYIHGWHLEAICDHLQAVARGEITQIIINIPPRCMKSITCNVAFPAWVWSQPDKRVTSGNGVRFLNATHSHKLALRDSVKCRRIVKSDWYQERWGDSVAIARDSDGKNDFTLLSGGGRMITSEKSKNTGHGGEILVFDDMIDASDIQSATKRDALIEWWDGTMSTRDNQSGVARVVIMQRLDDKDLVGHILRNEKGWEHLCLPMEYEKNHIFPCRTSLGFKDPRKVDGELLWEERFNRTQVERLKSKLKDKAAGQLQQRPSSKGGNILKSGSWQMWDSKKPYPAFLQVLQFYDTALEAGQENDYSARTTWGVFERKNADDKIIQCAMLLERWQDKVEYPALKQEVIRSAKEWQPDQVVIERKASGHILLQELRKTKIPVKAFDPKSQSKTYRAQLSSDMLDGGRVFYPDKQWARQVIDDCAKFPKGEHDDIVDTCVMCWLYLRKLNVISYNDDDDDEILGDSNKEKTSYY